MTDRNPWADIIGPCYRGSSLIRRFGWTEEEVAAAVASLHVLELVTGDGVRLYPTFQFEDGGPVPGLADVLRVLQSGLDSPWTWAQWVNAQADDDSGAEASSAIEQLRAGERERVLRDARHAAWFWSS